MERLNPNIEPRIVAVCGKLVVCELNKGEYAWASKRVINDILCGVKEIYYMSGITLRTPATLHRREVSGVPCMLDVYLTTPSIW